MPYSLLLGPSLALKQQNLATPEETMKVLLSDLLQVWVSGITSLEFRASVSTLGAPVKSSTRELRLASRTSVL